MRVSSETSPDHSAEVEKDRSGLYQDKIVPVIDEDFGRSLAEWLGRGDPVAHPTAHPTVKAVERAFGVTLAHNGVNARGLDAIGVELSRRRAARRPAGGAWRRAGRAGAGSAMEARAAACARISTSPSDGAATLRASHLRRFPP